MKRKAALAILIFALQLLGCSQANSQTPRKLESVALGLSARHVLNLSIYMAQRHGIFESEGFDYIRPKGTGKEWEARGLESAGREGGGVATGSMAVRVLRLGMGTRELEALDLSKVYCVLTMPMTWGTWTRP